MKIGFHLPISKGFKALAKEAKGLRCEAVQVFVKNPRSWKEKEWLDEEVDAARQVTSRLPVFAHLSYLPNLARADEDERHLKALEDEAMLACQVGARGLVVHCGSRGDKKKGLVAVALAVNRVCEGWPLDILLENCAGQGNGVGKSLEELATILEGVSKAERIFLCLDTAHLFAAGFAIGTTEGYESLMSRAEQLFGIDRIGLFHLNDSKAALGSRVDRHWHIGHGLMGKEAFRMIVNDKRFAHLCGIMETPKMGKWDRENMKTMRSLLSPLVSRSPS